MTFDELRTEYLEQGIGTQMYGLVLELAALVCRKYPEHLYNNGLSWDEQSVADLTQEVVLQRLIDEGQLDYIFTEATSVESIRRLLTLQIKRALHRRRPISAIDRLVKRIESLAVAGEIGRVPGAEKTYCRVGAHPEWAPMTAQQEVQAVNAAVGIPIHYSRLDATRESQIFTTKSLKEALEAFFSVSPALTEQELRRILERLLTPWTPASLVPIEDNHALEAEPMNTTAITDIDAAANQWVNELTEEECWVYYCRSLDLPDAVTAERIGKSRPTVINIKQRVLASAGSKLLGDLAPQHHLDAVKCAQEHCAIRLGESL